MPPPILSLQSSPVFISVHNPSYPENPCHNLLHLQSRRRTASVAALVTVFLAGTAAVRSSPASAFDFRVTKPGQTVEEAEVAVKIHARQLVDIKPLIDEEAWKETQRALRESSPYLKRDIYTIIQSRPGIQRPQLRKLYSKLFNSVTRLNYAARDKDAAVAQECYKTIVETLDQFFAII